jgi:hypothetical protein
MNSVTATEPDITKTKVPISLLWQVATVLISVLLAYAAVTNRVSVVETKQDESKYRMERIENKLDRVLERLPR